MTGAARYAITFTPAARRRLGALPLPAAAALYEHLTGPVAVNPRRLGKPLDAPFEEVLSTRRGDYRALYTVAYGLLHAILATAVADDALPANPARIRGATQVKRARKIRPAEPAELADIAEGMRPAYRALVLLAAWCGLRFGELAALRRQDIDLARGVVQVRRGVTHIATGPPVVGPPKSAAGVRDVAIPRFLIPLVADHLAEHTGPDPDALLFLSPSGTHLRSDSRMHDEFRAAAKAAGRRDLTFHGLRHTGATNAARAGATLADLMHRFGHSTPNAAMLYQHATAERDQVIAAALSDIATGNVVELRPRGGAQPKRATGKPGRKAST